MGGEQIFIIMQIMCTNTLQLSGIGVILFKFFSNGK